MMIEAELSIDDLTRTAPDELNGDAVIGRSCTLALSSHSEMTPFVGSCLLVDLSSGQGEISLSELQAAIVAAQSNAARLAEISGRPAYSELLERLILKTRSKTEDQGRPLEMETCGWIVSEKMLLIGTDALIFGGDEPALFSLLSAARIAVLLNLDLRGIECGVTCQLSAGPLLCSSGGLVPARVVVSY